MSASSSKRAVDQFSDGGVRRDEHSPKKPRFDVRNPSTLAADEPEDDAVLDLDEIGAGIKTKRNAVNIDGYESDSSNENFDARAEAKARQAEEENRKEEEEDADDDMFAILDEDIKGKEQPTEGRRKKAVKFLEDDEIEGQVFDSSSRNNVFSRDQEESGEISSEDDEGGDEVRDHIPMGMDPELGAGSKKKHAPRIDAFNMKREQEDGRFDENGNYVRKAHDPDAQYDNWLEGLSKKDIRRAKAAHKKQEEERRKKSLEQDAILTSDLLKKLIPRLEKGETVLEALGRLNKARKPKKPKWHKSKKSNDMEIEASPDEVAKEAKLKEAIDDITDAATGLFNKGQSDVWEAERELLIRQYQRETEEDWVDPVVEGEDGESKMWNYKWSNGDDKVYGPFDGPTMQGWNEQGFFTDGVEFQQVGRDEWSRLVDFV